MKIIKIAFCLTMAVAFLAALGFVLKTPRVSECVSTVAVSCPTDQR